MRYNTILFDADGTLFDYDRAEAYALTETITAFNLDCNPGGVINRYRKINGQIWQEFEQGQISAQELKIKRFARLFEDLGWNNWDKRVEAFSSTYLKNLALASFLIEDAVECVFRLKRICRLALITNGLKRVQRPRLEGSCIAGCFDAVVISEEVGCQKPEPEIFEQAFRMLDNPSRKLTLIVGDSLTSDIAGGKSFGIATCWFNPAGSANTSDITPDYEIASLPEIDTILS